MNKRQEKKKWNEICENRLERFVELTMRIQVQNSIVQRRSDASQDDILRTFLNGIEQEMTDIMYDMSIMDIRYVKLAEYENREEELARLYSCRYDDIEENDENYE